MTALVSQLLIPPCPPAILPMVLLVAICKLLMQHHLLPTLVADLVLEYNLVVKDYYLKVRGSNKRSHPHYF